uniref:Uncharacterized protein n=1 Tax=Oryza barthii TaxID=65489 RepID=A0A0D3HL99_9ORYZ
MATRSAVATGSCQAWGGGAGRPPTRRQHGAGVAAAVEQSSSLVAVKKASSTAQIWRLHSCFPPPRHLFRSGGLGKGCAQGDVLNGDDPDGEAAACGIVFLLIRSVAKSHRLRAAPA